jgi:dihydrofolate synthase/folylpolyglutamate synthase
LTKFALTIQTLLEPFAHFGVRLGLEPSRILLQNLGNPQEQVPVIHVAGSNGKGSVCAYLSSILVEAGYRVGRYTSPHLIDWNERICLNNQPIPTLHLIQLLEKVIDVAKCQDPLPTQFEIVTAAAWLYFAQNQVDFAVMEVGLGGRLDATNVCDRPLVSVITSISREHWQVLGSTVAEIAGEKAGILKQDCPAVVGQLPPEANTVVYRRAAELGCETTYPQSARDLGDGWVEYRGIEEYELTSEPLLEEGFESDQPELEETEIDPEDITLVHMMTAIRYRLPLAGAIQRHNSALAIAAIQVLREQGWEIMDDAIVDGIAKTRWAGRLQWIQWGDRPILIDGAHNPASAQVLREYVDELGSPTHWVMGMLVTKDHEEIFKALLRDGDSLSLVPVADHKTADPHELAKLAQTICPNLRHCATYETVETALQAATASRDRVVLCGSLYLIGQFLKQLQG